MVLNAIRETVPPSPHLPPSHPDSPWGLVTAFTVIGLWAVSLVWLLQLDLVAVPVFWLVPLFFGRVFLHTGLFITAHDAMHGSVYGANRKLNDAVGTLAVGLYALLPYQKLCTKHWQHHRTPATAEDPDFYMGEHRRWFPWYACFMGNYLKGRESVPMIVGINGVFYGLMWLGQVPVANLLLFWMGPLVLSSVQLFYFGIFLPHRRPVTGYTNRHRTMSNNFSPLWSFLSCYHFGYHWEHHEYPYLPWYKLALAHAVVSRRRSL
ncbi:fatty acid desaturase [Candidatus Cyanaurora vandensis]|uniref:fatty acid desaturase n=1 Tax=Candidatus Cyanaurora vandensis TaxID=2714958 RepID=UPI00258063C7|nr:fatty acid desaturase [Candidatus Cyanaurora vandensis]